jgi:RNA polymerase sigma-70 factor (ECF subfamily)
MDCAVPRHPDVAPDRIDQRFLSSVRSGNTAAHAMLYRRFSRRIHACLMLIVADSDTAADLTQDVFVKAFESAARFDGEPAGLAAWLVVIARNTAMDHMRKTSRTTREEPGVIGRRCEAPAVHPDPAWGDHESVHAAVARLSQEQQQVLVLHYRAGLHAAEIAHVLGKSPDAVRHIEQRALCSIRDRLPAIGI